MTWLRYNIGHAVAWGWGDKILNSRAVEFIHVSNEHIDMAWSIFQKYRDQKFSFTDCTFFAVMNFWGTSTVFAYDAHFTIAGFHVIGAVPLETMQ